MRDGKKDIAHLKEMNDGTWLIQTVDEHCTNTAKLAGSFASKFDCKSFGEKLGLFHDKGKDTPEFQAYIKNKSGYRPNPSAPAKAPHAAIGAKLALDCFPRWKQLIAYPILAHHAGLKDSDYAEKVFRETDVSSMDFEKQNAQPIPPAWASKGNVQPFEVNHWVRLLASCLVDADRLDTERFQNPEQSNLRAKKKKLSELATLLDAYLEKLGRDAQDTPVNRIRAGIQHTCINRSSDGPGFYSLSVPTGGGKTLSSLAWAMRHAMKNGKERIIVAIPYTSIVSQTADVFQGIFGKENVLEHHSAFEIADLNTEDITIHDLATENWDYPIIVTTNVQLFESLYASKAGRFRKIHNVCNSVLILDEVQSLPVEFLRPILEALETYNHLFGVSVLFTTASTPVFDRDIFWHGEELLRGLPSIHEIIPKEMDLAKKLQRVAIHFDDGESSYADIAERMSRYGQCLCVTNTRSNAREIFKELPGDVQKIHLSRLMCPRHIKTKIDEIKRLLKLGSTVRVVSTQLIEAGVDIDFPVVFRERSGLDSIIQAAGRCNREGHLPKGDAYVFSFDHIPRGFMQRADNARRALGKDRDWFNPQTMREYFMHLYERVPSFDVKHIHESLQYIPNMQFETAAENFRLIQDDSMNVIVPYEGFDKPLEALLNRWKSYSIEKELSQYCVAMRKHDFDDFRAKGLIEEVCDGIYRLVDANRYNEETGLVLADSWPEEILMV